MRRVNFRVSTVNIISFDKLGIYDIKIDRVAIKNIFGTGINIYWYAIIITFGMILAVIFAMWQAKKFGLKSDNIVDVALWGVPFALIGARLYFVVFMLDHFDSLWDMINFRNGGLAIYGAVIAGFITGLIFCRVKKINALALFDVCSFGFFIGQAIGRWGNFVNAEAYGSETNLPWGMTIVNLNEVTNETTDVVSSVHPTFLYESLWNVIGLLIAFFIIKRLRKENGEIFCFYMGWYGAGRAVIEGLRQDSLRVLGVFRVSQILGIVFAVLAVVFFILLRAGVVRKLQSKAEAHRLKKNGVYANVFEGGESEEAPITVNESDLFMASLEAHRGRNQEDTPEAGKDDGKPEADNEEAKLEDGKNGNKEDKR